MLRDRFTEGMGRVPNAVCIVTTDGQAGRAGVTASTLSSVSADGPGLLVCIHHLSPACAAIQENGVFCVNVLRAGAAVVANTFAGRAKTDDGNKFSCARWRTLETGAPVLDQPLVAFDCRLGSAMRWNTHFIFVGDVAAVELGEAEPLLYGNRTFGRFAPLSVAEPV
jgi:flavin reductase (DIM6/NTAB) family NADH-FMN oxidoreductase RutF